MKARLTALTALLAGGGAALAIAAAPAALAQPNCEQTSSGGGGYQGGATTLCESPGNAQISYPKETCENDAEEASNTSCCYSRETGLPSAEGL